MSDPLKQFLLQEQENQQKKREPWRYFKQKPNPTVTEILKERDNKNFVESLPKYEGNQGEIKLAEDTNPVVNAINQYFREAAYYVNNNKVPKGKHTLPAITLTALGISPFITSPATATTGLLGGMLGGATTDYQLKYITGKDWGEHVSNLTGLDSNIAAYTNPGYIMGANRALAARANRLAAYKQVPQLISKQTGVVIKPKVPKQKQPDVLTSKNTARLTSSYVAPKLLTDKSHADIILEKYLNNPDLIPTRKDLNLLRQSSAFKYYDYPNITSNDVNEVRVNLGLYNPFASNKLLKEQAIPENFEAIMDPNYDGSLNQDIYNFLQEFGNPTTGNPHLHLKFRGIMRNNDLPIQYRHLTRRELYKPKFSKVRTEVGIPELPGITGKYSYEDINKFEPHQIRNFMRNSDYSEGAVSKNGFGFDRPEDVLKILFNNSQKDLDYQILKNLETMSSGNVYTYHSLSTDSYPIVQNLLYKMLRQGKIIPVKQMPGNYTSLNDLGIRNVWDFKDLRRWFNTHKNLIPEKFTFTPLENQTYQVLYDGNPVSTIRRYTNQEIANYLNHFNRKLFGSEYPKVIGSSIDIKIPRLYYFTYKNGGKI